MTFISSWRMARAAHDTAREAADASVRVATVEQEGERRIRMDDRTYKDRCALVYVLLEFLRQLEFRPGMEGAVDWGQEPAVVNYGAEGTAIDSRMKAVFPSAVMDAANSAMDAALGVAQAKATTS